jgi:hypothetical protein
MTDKKKAAEFEKLMLSLAEDTDKLNYVAFLANLDLIKTYLDKGYTAKSIWKSLTQAELISFSYVTFTLYLKKHHLKQAIKDLKIDSTTAEDKDTYTAQLAKQTNNTATSLKEEPVKLKLPVGMSHNPNINPKDLI